MCFLCSFFHFFCEIYCIKFQYTKLAVQLLLFCGGCSCIQNKVDPRAHLAPEVVSLGNSLITSSSSHFHTLSSHWNETQVETAAFDHKISRMTDLLTMRLEFEGLRHRIVEGTEVGVTIPAKSMAFSALISPSSPLSEDLHFFFLMLSLQLLCFSKLTLGKIVQSFFFFFFFF